LLHPDALAFICMKYLVFKTQFVPRSKHSYFRL